MVGSSDRGSIHALEGSRALSPSEFSFFGFGALRRDELRKILRLGIRNDEPRVSDVEGAVFVPNGYQSSAEQPKFAGGVVRPDGRPIDTAVMHRKGGKRFGGLVETIGVSPQQEVDEEVVYLGLLFNHYGRVLLESLSRVWYLQHVDPSRKVVFTNANSAEAAHAPWVPRLLAAFGIPQARLLALDAPTQLRRAIVPEPLFEQFYSAHPDMLGPFREVAARIAGDVKPSEQPVYLSRRLLSSRQRPVIGEAELEEVLRENGFAIAYPETMSLEDQVRLVNAHTDIVSSIGSAAHNVLFALNQPRLHLLVSRDDVPANYFLCSVLAAAPTTFVDCLGAGGRITANDERLSRREETFGNDDKKRPVDLDAGPQAMPQLVDMPSVIDYLDSRGFLRNRLRASLARRNPPPLRQYDEAWLYARLRKGAAKSGDLAPEIAQEAMQLAPTS
jgi:hypothetical protein